MDWGVKHTFFSKSQQMINQSPIMKYISENLLIVPMNDQAGERQPQPIVYIQQYECTQWL